MGYTTTFKGILNFKEEVTVKELAHLSKFLGEDARDHYSEWDKEWEDLGVCYVDFELAKDFSGIQWNENEKFYYAVEIVNLLTKEMKKIKPTFEFKGKLCAQGEEYTDKWTLQIVDGVAKNIPFVMKGKLVTCPCCGEEFIHQSKK